jgi:hypothetical protein
MGWDSGESKESANPGNGGALCFVAETDADAAGHLKASECVKAGYGSAFATS